MRLSLGLFGVDLSRMNMIHQWQQPQIWVSIVKVKVKFALLQCRTLLNGPAGPADL